MSGSAPRIDLIEGSSAIAGALASAAGVTTLVSPTKISVPYTTIVNRASIPDLANDAGVSFGVNRIMVQSIYQLQDEFGPNGEPVFAAVNDERGMMRFVGGWNSQTDYGSYIYSLNTNDYVEITFYGTGLNALIRTPQAALSSMTYSVDGNTATSWTPISGTPSSVLSTRNYAQNSVAPVVSGLSLGIHTVLIKITSGGTYYLEFFGFEILNTSSTTSLTVKPGSAIGSQKNTLSALTTTPYNSGFESGALGTKGGRVLAYLKSDGTIGKAVTPTDASAAYLASASHTNEEVIRRYHWREFGAGRSDDFSGNITSGSSLAFTLDDGTTTLVGSLSAPVNNSGSISNSGNISIVTNGGFLTLTFVGTGLDLLMYDSVSGGNDSYTYQIDGGTATAWPNTSGSTSTRTQKIVSGLPYGTHTFKINRVAAVTWSPCIQAFIVYGPKKPTLPTGAVELADYNVMADFTPNTTVGVLYISQGVLRKAPIREVVYVDSANAGNAWGYGGGALSVIPSIECAFQLDTNRNAAYCEYTFFGTGFELKTGIYTNNSNSISVSLNGTSLNSSYPGAASINVGTIGTGMTYGAASGSSFLLSTVASNVLNVNGVAAISGCTFRVWNLPLGKYTLRFTNNNNPNYLPIDALDIITPVHSAKSNLLGDLQNTLPVGSQSLSDSRKFSTSQLGPQKAWAQAVAISSPTTNVTTLVPLPYMSITLRTSGGRVRAFFNGTTFNNTLAQTVQTVIFVDGSQASSFSAPQEAVASYNVTNVNSWTGVLSAGVHKFDVYWAASSSGTATGVQSTLNFIVEEV
jgi:hypothetical protein